ncbi:MAG: hypothetical protein GF317_10130 [Candidatus Lokiarchaeota archaeon]|nr:hypothetical protein [Candidatus Lokiarchaeota archaeon]
MFKEIIAKFQGLNVEDIYNDVIKVNPSLDPRFKNYKLFSDLGGRTRGHLLEFAVYHFMNQGALFNVMQKGSDFVDKGEAFDMKCITLRENEISLSGDTPIGAFDNRPYSTANAIKKLKHLVMPIINRELEIIDVREFRAKEIEDELLADWRVIHTHIMNNKEGNCNGSHCKYLRAKKRGDRYYIMFTQNRDLNLVKSSHSIAKDKTPIKNKQRYMNNIKKQFMNVVSLDEFKEDFKAFGIKGVYDKYILNGIDLDN